MTRTRQKKWNWASSRLATALALDVVEAVLFRFWVRISAPIAPTRIASEGPRWRFGFVSHPEMEEPEAVPSPLGGDRPEKEQSGLERRANSLSTLKVSGFSD